MKMNLVLDLYKSGGTLNTSKLVKKPILVRGKDGKVFTRMQWVSPGDLPTSGGSKGTEKTKEKKKKSLNVPPPKIKTKEEITEDKEKVQKFQDAVDKTKVKKAKQKSKIDKGEDTLSKDSEVTVNQFVEKVTKVNPKISKIMKAITSSDLASGSKYGIGDDLGNLTQSMKEHEKVIYEDVLAMINSDPNSSDRVKKVQENALKNGDMDHKYWLAIHPDIARTAVDSILGKKVADSVREKLKESTLSINFQPKYKESIFNSGYTAETIESKASSELNELGYNTITEILSGDSDTTDNLETLRQLLYDIEDADYRGDREKSFTRENLKSGNSGSSVVRYLRNRIEAEHKSIGLSSKDPRPTYVAYNAFNYEEGAHAGYGRGWLKVDDSILSECTVTFNDNFVTSNSLPKAHSMEHLADAFIIKSMGEYGYDMKNTRGDEPSWMDKATSQLPLEIHYHNEGLSTEQFTIGNPEKDHDKLFNVDFKALEEEENTKKLLEATKDNEWEDEWEDEIMVF